MWRLKIEGTWVQLIAGRGGIVYNVFCKQNPNSRWVTSRVNEVLRSADMLQIMLNDNNGDITTEVKSLLMRPVAELISTHYADMQPYTKWLFWDDAPCSLVETDRRFRDVSHSPLREPQISQQYIVPLKMALRWVTASKTRAMCHCFSALFRAQSVHDIECSAAAVMWWVLTNRTLPDVSVWKRWLAACKVTAGQGMRYATSAAAVTLRSASSQTARRNPYHTLCCDCTFRSG
jgi:hypothetical protein